MKRVKVQARLSRVDGMVVHAITVGVPVRVCERSGRREGAAVRGDSAHAQRKREEMRTERKRCVEREKETERKRCAHLERADAVVSTYRSHKMSESLMS